MSDWNQAYMQLAKRDQAEQAEREETIGRSIGHAIFIAAVLAAVVWWAVLK